MQRDAWVAFVPIGFRFDDASGGQFAIKASKNVLTQQLAGRQEYVGTLVKGEG
jgi:hypothetical protein